VILRHRDISQSRYHDNLQHKGQIVNEVFAAVCLHKRIIKAGKLISFSEGRK
jgi:hypothetical protein